MKISKIKRVICWLKRRHLWFTYIETTESARWLLSNEYDRICLRCGKIERSNVPIMKKRKDLEFIQKQEWHTKPQLEPIRLPPDAFPKKSEKDNKNAKM